MITQEVKRLWRVSWVHRRGYRAPDRFVWAKCGREERLNAIRLAKESSRLRDFPELWHFTIEQMDVFDPPKMKGPKGPF